MKKLLAILVLLALVLSCGTARYTNITVIDNERGEVAYYPGVQIRSYEVTDSSSAISFVDRTNHLWIICGKSITVETVTRYRNDAVYYNRFYPGYYYYISPPRHYYYRRHLQPHYHRGGRR